MQDNTQRFTSRVENYIKYRPGYPQQVLDILKKACGLSSDWRIADVGSGTGLLTELFLKNGNTVIGVEPNKAMREAGEALLRGYTGFTSVDGTAESTGLEDQSVDVVTAGQAFHWFDREKARSEFARILKPGGWVVLVWNERKHSSSQFMNAYERFLLDFCPEYARVSHKNITDESFAAFFTPYGFEKRLCKNEQHFDFEQLKGRLLSSSYAVEPGQSGYMEMVSELERIFDRYQHDGIVAFEYDTSVYTGRISGGKT